MKRIKLLALLLLTVIAQQTLARDGYRIQVKLTDKKDTVAYLAHYYGKSLPTIYKADSARFDKNGVATIESKEKTLGGIYMILLSDKQTYFEFLLNNGDDMTITATAAKLPEGLVFKNSPENDRFQSYVAFLQDFGKKQQALQGELKAAKTAADTAAVRKKATEESKTLTAYRHDYVKKYPNTLLSSIFNALEVPVVPEGTHYLADGKVDSNFAYDYYKGHYWDGFDFKDDRLIHTPIYDAKLEEYMNKLVLPMPDSVIKEGDMLLEKTRGQKELFKYTLWWLTRNAETSKIMGMDQVFVYLVETYYMRGDAYWLDNDALQKYFDRVRNIAPNIIGNVAPELKLNDVNGKPQSLSDLKAKYTLLLFYSPDCGHCQQEIPKLDSVYRASLKAKGMKIYAVATEDETKWKDFIVKNNMSDWTNVADWDRKSDFRSKYDVYSTPVIYLLDEKKIIRGKRLDHTNILSVVDMLEQKEKKNNSK
ncbi:TlpA family protein disulfide reductase [Taibaiella soli]|nr:TlpA family protein disulfide reductase [Taibaiella soli]